MSVRESVAKGTLAREQRFQHSGFASTEATGSSSRSMHELTRSLTACLIAQPVDSGSCGESRLRVGSALVERISHPS